MKNIKQVKDYIEKRIEELQREKHNTNHLRGHARVNYTIAEFQFLLQAIKEGEK